MTRPSEVLNGEPVAIIAGIVVALANLAGVHWTEGAVQAAIVAISPLVGALIARSKVTPAVNPAQPTVTVENAAGEPIEVSKPTTPVWTFPAGRREGDKDDE